MKIYLFIQFTYKLIIIQKPILITKKNIDIAANVFLRAFEDYPIWKYMIPDINKRRTDAIAIWEYMIRYGLKFGKVFATSKNFEGISIWLPSKYIKKTFWRQLYCKPIKVIRKLGMNFVKRANIVDKILFEENRKYAPFPHWYGALGSIDPQYQGKGFAKLLISGMDQINAKDKFPYYLETSKEVNVSIYKHMGFKVVGKTWVPNTDVPIWSMLKQN